MKGTRRNEKLFWNARAENYPLPFEPGTLSRTERILRLLGGMGAEFEGRRILDIGCGTGIYGLPLAAKARSVLCLDSSAAMLKILRAERRARGMDNVSCLRASWSDIPLSRLSGRFDLALASMTMAVKNRTDIVKMEKAAAERCVYIGWAGVRRNGLMEKIYRGHGLEYKAPPGAEAVIPVLRSLGREFSLTFIRDSWERTATVRETFQDVALSMRVNGARLRETWLEGLLEKAAVKGEIKQLTRVRKAVITWRSVKAGR